MYEKGLFRSGLAVMAAILAASVAVPSAMAGSAAGPASFADPSGDANGAPDIGAVAVGENANGAITFRIQTDQPTHPAGSGLFVFVNADDDVTTGGGNDGLEYAFGLDDSGFHLVRYTPGGLAPVASEASGTWQDGIVTFTVDRRDLGGTTSFTFFAGSALSSAPQSMRDDAPDVGVWHFTSAYNAVLRLTIEKVLVDQVSRTLTVAALVRRSDTGAFVGTEGALRCSARIGTKALAAKHAAFVATTFQGVRMRVGICAWPLPPDAVGKTVRGTMTVGLRGATVSRSFAARVR